MDVILSSRGLANNSSRRLRRGITQVFDLMRRVGQAFLLLLAATLLAGCTPSVSEAEVQALAAVAPELMANPVGNIASPWPTAVADFDPDSVYRSPEGVYIATWDFFVEEGGVFLLDPQSSFAPSRGTDPAYEPVAGNVFTYHIRG